jgi:hypothetical protein
VLKWLHTNECPWDQGETCLYAASGGHLEILKWLHANGCPWDCDTLTNAEEAGHDHIVKWARANGCPEPSW